MDGLRIGILPPNSILNDTYLGKSLKINKNLYPLFVRKTQNSIKTNSEITYTNMNLSDLFKTKNNTLSPGQRIDIFSKTYISNLFTKNEETSAAIVKIASSSSDELDAFSDKNNTEPDTEVSGKNIIHAICT